ncbi:nucleoside 2-deoxyribosyltransferase [Rhizobium rhizogenes]|uniref:Putative 2'-deoxynucleoside 5'-phosphate N-hydrolase 1 n=1 Tax=Rhizobium rhizogenes NBRC 13257 TaxID=1220581 RepID=A0AA87QB61_RHIRH|nr:nucleoside 2-deoxyribosyltransferase [Rhizobium rhizogenes]GAJ97097.1 hypothetical protein RRH01S_31_00290 [Rhizobium rhizogenes NBRC 13257]
MEERTNIYFAGSIRGGRKDVELYSRIIGRLKRYGDVLTEHVGDYSLSVEGQKQLPDRYICQRDLQWLRSSQLVVAEVTVPSLGVGYEIAAAVERKIPVIALFRTTEGTQLSAMVRGSDGIFVFDYSDIDVALSNLDYIMEEGSWKRM